MGLNSIALRDRGKQSGSNGIFSLRSRRCVGEIIVGNIRSAVVWICKLNATNAVAGAVERPTGICAKSAEIA